MTRIDRQDLRELTLAFVLANTPPSLFKELDAQPAVHRMRSECARSDLETYYHRITTRADRSEMVMGLAYAVLVAILTTDQPGNPVDSSRLQWGEAIEELAQKSGRTTQYLIIRPDPPRPRVWQQQDTGGGDAIIPASTNVIFLPEEG